jgi:hypothetical protein
VTWETPTGQQVEVYGQAEFDVVSPNYGISARSVSALLIPDCTIVIRDGSVERVFVLDAKFRGDNAMSAGQINEAASPYLWSLRRGSEASEHALERVLIVSSGPVGTVASEGRSRMSAVAAVPQTTAALHAAIRHLLSL